MTIRKSIGSPLEGEDGLVRDHPNSIFPSQKGTSVGEELAERLARQAIMDRATSFCCGDPPPHIIEHVAAMPLDPNDLAAAHAVLGWISTAGLVISHPPAGGREDLREKVALNVMRWMMDSLGDWPMDKVARCLAAISEPHYGDCTKAPITCLRCEAEAAYKQADELLALLQPDPEVKP